MNITVNSIADLVFNITAALFTAELSRLFLKWAEEDCNDE